MRYIMLAMIMLVTAQTASAQYNTKGIIWFGYLPIPIQYVGVDTGMGLYTTQDDASVEWQSFAPEIQLALGGTIAEPLRTEFRLGYYVGTGSNDELDIDLKYSVVHLTYNIYLDFKINKAITIYPTVGFGVGFTKIVLVDAADGTGTALLTHAGLGAAYDIDDNHRVSVELRYVANGETRYEMGSSRFGEDIIFHTTAYTTTVGYKYLF
jgi:opacity protein-like surface antigen